MPTYGVGQDKAKTWWQGLIRQMVAGGYLTIDIEGYGGLKLTSKGDGVLRGQGNVEIRQIKTKVKKASTRKTRIAADIELSDVDHELLSRLKTLRRELASERNVPAYSIFSDATLTDMCHLRPENLDQMGSVNGIGPKKLKDFGTLFLEVVRSEF